MILDKYKRNLNVEIIHTENGGVAKARNIALQSMIGKYVMFVDSDDIIAPKFNSKLLWKQLFYITQKLWRVVIKISIVTA